ncbi:MAG: hypothetical protein ABSH13_18395 [Candidatus Acidiferrum sp.]
MGSEAACKAHFGKTKLTGKALLETAELIFRPADGSPSRKLPFSTIKSAQAIDGQLHVQTPNGPAIFELGLTAEKWCHKILHPKTRAEKLGVKPGIHVSLLGDFDPDFFRELRAATKNVYEGKFDATSDLIFLSVNSAKNLAPALNKATKSIKGATALWIVYPKGQKEITEIDVLSSGRKAGLKDVKIVGFSPTHTALKFVVPLDKR